jgi:hypothetical protein
MQVKHDAFARGGYDRRSQGKGKCCWCGQERRVMFTFVWEPDDNTRGTDRGHRAAKQFCNFQCFESYHG